MTDDDLRNAMALHNFDGVKRYLDSIPDKVMDWLEVSEVRHRIVNGYDREVLKIGIKQYLSWRSDEQSDI